jgi:hypothetical protein
MTRASRTILLPMLLTLLAAPIVLAAQEDMGPPPVLVINREFLKPGRTGTPHEKTEGAYLAAAHANKAPFHYLAVTSLTGPDRALFLSPYPSFAAWEADSKSADKIPALGAALDHAMLADGDLLASTDESAWMHRPDLSYAEVTLNGARYFEIQQVTIKPGKLHEAEEWGKMYVDGYKGIPGANWSAFQQVYGSNSNTFLFITLLKSLSETDAEWGSSNTAFEKNMGPDKMKKLRALENDVVDTEMTNLFRISPKMSLPWDSLMKDDPDFWKPKPTAAPMKKPQPKPGQ